MISQVYLFPSKQNMFLIMFLHYVLTLCNALQLGTYFHWQKNHRLKKVFAVFI